MALRGVRNDPRQHPGRQIMFRPFQGLLLVVFRAPLKFDFAIASPDKPGAAKAKQDLGPLCFWSALFHNGQR